MRRIPGWVLLLALLVSGCGGGNGTTASPGTSTDGPPANPVVAQPSLTLLAGTPGGKGNLDGPADLSRFWRPAGMGIDAAGNLYVADGDVIRRVSSDRDVTTVAGKSLAVDATLVDGPAGQNRVSTDRIAVAAAGTVYFTQGAAVRKLARDGTVSTIANTIHEVVPNPHPDEQPVVATNPQYVLVDGPLGTATFGELDGIAADPAGNLFVIDNGRLRRIGTDGQVRTLAGVMPQWMAPPTAVDTSSGVFMGGVTTDAAGNAYAVCTNQGQLNRILRFAPDGSASDYPGSGSPQATPFSGVRDLAASPDGTLYVIDGNALRRIAKDGSVTTLATIGQLRDLSRLAVDAAGNVYIDYGPSSIENPYTIERITPAGSRSTWAGREPSRQSVDGVGMAASFAYPHAVSVDPAGNVVVLDGPALPSLRKVLADGTVSTIVAAGAGLNYAQGLAADSAGNVYVADTNNHVIRKIDASGVMSVFAGVMGAPGSEDGPRGTGKLWAPQAVVVGRDGALYVAEATAIRKITPDGTVSTLAGNQQRAFVDGTGAGASFRGLTSIFLDASGNLLVCDAYALRRVTLAGEVTTLVAANWQSAPVAWTAADAAGNVYGWLLYGHTVQRRAPDGTVTVVAGVASEVGLRTGTPGSLGEKILAVAVLPAASSGGRRLLVVTENCLVTVTLPA